MKAGSALSATWSQRYEALRQYVLGGPQGLATPALGLLLLLHKGVAAWMESWGPPAGPPTSGPDSGTIPCPETPGWQQQLTLLLAQMTTAHLPRIATP